MNYAFDANRIVTDEKADSCQWDTVSMVNDKLQHTVPRSPPNALVVHMSLGIKRTLDDDRKGDMILHWIPVLEDQAVPINTVLTYA